jgi:ankyrin repeat protein
MHLAAQKGKLIRLKKALATSDPDEVNEENVTALWLACYNGHIQCVQALLDAKADPNFLSYRGSTAIMSASMEGHLDVVNLLLSARADISLVDASRETALSYACKRSTNYAVASALIDAKAKLGAAPGADCAPMHSAFKARALDIIKLLVDSKADVNEADRVGVSPLGYCNYFRDPVTAQLLIDHKADIHKKVMSQSYLHNAVFLGSGDMVKLLIEAKVSLTYADEDDYTPLHHAVDINCDLAQEFADKSGVDPDRVGSPMDKATAAERLRIVQMLIDAKSDVNAVSSVTGRTPLALAASLDYAPAIALLVKAGARVNDATSEQDFHGSALHYAIARGSTKAVKALIEAKADLEQRIVGQTPVMLAMESENDVATQHETCKLLLAAKANVNAIVSGQEVSIYDISVRHNIPIIRALLAEYRALSWLSLTVMKSPFLKAIASQIFMGVELLLPSASKKERETGMIAACTRGYREVVQLLLKHGVDPCARRGLAYPIIEAGAKGYVDIVKDLLAAKADMNIKSANGLTPLQVAAKNGHRNVVAVFVAKANELKRMKANK